jgi:hypothetical protein
MSNMASLPPVIVHVEKPTGILFSECFAEMRLWLAAHKITPVYFQRSGGYSSIGLDIAFSDSEDADLFEREFSPTVVSELRRPPDGRGVSAVTAVCCCSD